MTKHIVALPRTPGIELDIVSYGRRGPGGAIRLTPGQIEQVKRTVGRTPEVMVKVSGGARDIGGARAHLKYLGRHGKLEIETDEGLLLRGRDAASHLVHDWQLDLCRGAHLPEPADGQKDTRSKLVHNIVLSMPAGTPPQKVLNAARLFARENFALQYRYAMVLHIDQAHPHVHLVVKCEHEFEAGKRLYIRKDTLRQWREHFASLMREQGVAANATPRQLRGRGKGFKDPIHQRLRNARAFRDRPAAEGMRFAPKESTFMRRKVEGIVKELQTGRLAPEDGKARLQETRKHVVDDWRATAQALVGHGQGALADQVEKFVRALPPVQTDRERIAARLLERLAARRQATPSKDRDPPRSR